MDLATGAMGSLLPKLLKLVKDEYKLQKGVKKEVHSLSRELRSIEVALRKVAEVPRDQLDKQVKLWADDVRELSYHMEDIIDRFLVRVEGSETGANTDRFKRLVKKIVNLFKKGKASHQIADAIKDIKQQVKEVAARRDRNKVDDLVPNSAGATTVDRRLLAMYSDVTNLVGIDEPRDELIKMLTEKSDGVKVVSVVGFGGLGKTTFSKVAYDNLKPQFDRTAFVSVSQKPEIKRIFRNTLHQLDQGKHEAWWDERLLIDELRRLLQTRRYFIVIDDLWDGEAWEIIKCAFVENNNGSRIIVTTRDFHIAEQVGDSYKLKPLTLKSSKILLYRRVFGSEECPTEFVEVSENILNKCGGIPLAITTMASLLTVSSEKLNLKEWCEVHDSIGSGLRDDPNLNNMRSILSLSYYNLPSHLRTCLLYLSKYPEDYEIPRDSLIWKWVAEGFVSQKNKGVSLFELGNSYFGELINRGMIQPCIDSDGDLKNCRLHDMVLDLIYSLSSEENFATVLDDHTEGSMSSHRNIRRLSLQSRKEDHQNTPLASSLISHVRSITIFKNAIDLVPAFSAFDVLRVLDMRGCYLGEGSHIRLRDIGNLLHLRYLGLANTSISNLPAEVGKLQFLQVFDVRGNRDLFEFSLDVSNLIRLMCLLTTFTWLPVDGMANLTAMEVLQNLKASINNVKELCKLTRLRELDILVSDGGLEMEEAFVGALCMMHNIQSLSIEVDCSIEPSWDILGGQWVPPQHFREFRVHRVVFPRLPAWIKRNPSVFTAISMLLFSVNELQQEDLHSLGRLPALRELWLESKIQTQRLLFINADGFQCTTEFRLRGAPLVWERGALPRAKIVGFNYYCRVANDNLNNGDIDMGLVNLPSLVMARIIIDRRGVTVGEAKKTNTALCKALEVHSNYATARAIFDPAIPRGAGDDDVCGTDEE